MDKLGIVGTIISVLLLIIVIAIWGPTLIYAQKSDYGTGYTAGTRDAQDFSNEVKQGAADPSTALPLEKTMFD